MFKVLIDTNAFEHYGLSMEGSPFEALRELHEDGKIQIITSNVIISEIYAHIEESVSKSVNRLQKALKNCDRVFLADIAKFPNLETSGDDIKKQIITYRKAKVDDFFSDVDAKYIDVDNIQISQVLNDYFEKKAPFGEGKKKAEFPDAIILNSLLLANEEDLEQLFIVSEDSGWGNFFQSHEQVKVFSKISELTDYVNSDFDQIISLKLHEGIASLKEDITNSIRSLIESATFNLDDQWIDPEIYVDTTSIKIDIEDINLISLDGEEADWEISIQAAYVLYVTAQDPDAFYKAPDTKEWICLGSNSYEIKIVNTGSVFCKTAFEPDCIKNSIEVRDVELSDDILCIDENEAEIYCTSEWQGDGWED